MIAYISEKTAIQRTGSSIHNTENDFLDPNKQPRAAYIQDAVPFVAKSHDTQGRYK